MGSMADLLIDYTAQLRREMLSQKKSPRTVVLYIESLRQFIVWLEDGNISPDTTALTRKLLIEWRDWLVAHRSPGTTVSRIQNLQVIGKWLYEEGEIPEPVGTIPTPDYEAKPVPVLDDDTIGKLIHAASKERDPFTARRDELVIRLLLDTGVRLAELVGIRMDDLEIDDGSIRVVGKGSKARTVHYGIRTGRAMDRYLRLRKKHQATSLNRLLVGVRGPLTRSGIRFIIHALCDRAGVPRTHAHAFRHTWAHDWLDHGGQERDLMRLAGWSSTAMLDVYGSQLAVKRAENAHRRLSRGDRV